MGDLLEIDVNAKRVQEALKGTRLSMKTIGKKTFRVIGQGVRQAINKSIRQTTTKRTGALLKAYKYYPTSAGGIVRVDKNIPNGDDMFRKIYALNYGYSGPVGRARNRPHSFIERGEEYLASGQWVGKLDKMVEKEIKKYWG